MWELEYQYAFNTIKGLLVSSPVLMMPNIIKLFLLAVDISDISVGAVLLQGDQEKIEHPISYFLVSLINTREISPLV